MTSKDTKRKEYIRKRGLSLLRKATQLGEGGDIPVILMYYDPIYGWDGTVHLPTDFELPNIEEIATRLHTGCRPVRRQRRPRPEASKRKNDEKSQCSFAENLSVEEEITVETDEPNQTDDIENNPVELQYPSPSLSGQSTAINGSKSNMPSAEPQDSDILAAADVVRQEASNDSPGGCKEQGRRLYQFLILRRALLKIEEKRNKIL